jgi:hypothetical protein
VRLIVGRVFGMDVRAERCGARICPGRMRADGADMAQVWHRGHGRISWPAEIWSAPFDLGVRGKCAGRGGHWRDRMRDIRRRRVRLIFWRVFGVHMRAERWGGREWLAVCAGGADVARIGDRSRWRVSWRTGHR